MHHQLRERERRRAAISAAAPAAPPTAAAAGAAPLPGDGGSSGGEDDDENDENDGVLKVGRCSSRLGAACCFCYEGAMNCAPLPSRSALPPASAAAQAAAQAEAQAYAWGGDGMPAAAAVARMLEAAAEVGHHEGLSLEGEHSVRGSPLPCALPWVGCALY
jgi:hypothetical protein